VKIARVFDNANLYNLFQIGVQKSGTKDFLSSEILKTDSVERVLDFGSGIGHHSQLFQGKQYLGIEPLESCVLSAKRLYKDSTATFLLGDHTALKSLPESTFDLVFAIGVLHHIDDLVFNEFVNQAFRLLKPGARLMTFDPVLHGNQSKLSKWVVKQDRGHWVRTENEYLAVIKTVFSGDTDSRIYSKLLRIPYDHILINTTKPL
jgi:SAM-dependent methyltransferase